MRVRRGSGVLDETILSEVQHWAALELFRARKISAGKAAEVAGVSLANFMDLTRQHNVAWIDYTADELEVELDEAVALGEATQKRGG